MIGNGYCNDQTNNVECNFDGGDCCLINDQNIQSGLCHSNGIIISPGYPQAYDNNLDLYWLIEVPIGQTIRINFISFDLQYGWDCS